MYLGNGRENRYIRLIALPKPKGGSAIPAMNKRLALIAVALLVVGEGQWQDGVKIELSKDGKLVYTDYLSLLKFDSGWRIVAKVYHRHGD